MLEYPGLVFLSQETDNVLLALQPCSTWYLLLEESDMATSQIEIDLEKSVITEGSAMDAVVNFRTRSTASASTPITARYRIDCLSTKTTVRGWTTFTPAGEVTLSITAGDNAIQGTAARERKQIIVQADYGTDNQFVGRKHWLVENLHGIS